MSLSLSHYICVCVRALKIAESVFDLAQVLRLISNGSFIVLYFPISNTETIANSSIQFIPCQKQTKNFFYNVGFRTSVDGIVLFVLAEMGLQLQLLCYASKSERNWLREN